MNLPRRDFNFRERQRNELKLFQLPNRIIFSNEYDPTKKILLQRDSLFCILSHNGNNLTISKEISTCAKVSKMNFRPGIHRAKDYSYASHFF